MCRAASTDGDFEPFSDYTAAIVEIGLNPDKYLYSQLVSYIPDYVHKVEQDYANDQLILEEEEGPLYAEHPWWWALTQVRYILNMIFFAIPYTLIGAALIIWNLVCNIYFNEGWAGANIWLIWNTVFLVGQYLMGILLYWEIDLWIHYAKFPRFISLIMGLVSDIWWFAELIIMYGIVDDWDHTHVTYTYLYTAMVLSYDLIMHVNVLPINFLLFAKEFTMEFF